MTNNDILRRLRYALDINDAHVAKILAHVVDNPDPARVCAWMRRDDHEGFVVLPDTMLCSFLDGLIIEKRGPHPSGAVPEAQAYLPTNAVLKKLRIALSMRDEDMMEAFKLAEFVVTKSELGAFYRAEGQRNYRKCPEQVLRKFLLGLGKKIEMERA
jgi:uncharacterized protein YehS (DUF1456 family)